MTEGVQAALVGAGGFAGGHVVPHLASYAGLKYVAVCDPDREAAQRAAETIGAEHVTADSRDVLALDGVRMVDLQTPNFLHAEQALAAFAAGKHVLVQKPMATSLAEATAMVQAGRRARRLLGVYMDDLNDPLLWDMKAAIEQGVIGRPVGFRVRYAHSGGLALRRDSWRRSLTKTGGGCFLLLTVHFVHVIGWLLGTCVARVAGFTRTLLAPMEGDDSAAGVLELENGLVGTAEASYLVRSHPDFPHTLVDVYGTEGNLSYRRDGQLLVHSLNRTFHGETGAYETPGQVGVLRSDRGVEHRPAVHERFASAILGRGEPAVAGEAGRRDLAVCLALAEASRTGGAVDLDAMLSAEG